MLPIFIINSLTQLLKYQIFLVSLYIKYQIVKCLTFDRVSVGKVGGGGTVCHFFVIIMTQMNKITNFLYVCKIKN